jgi:hypothetical protein
MLYPDGLGMVELMAADAEQKKLISRNSVYR